MREALDVRQSQRGSMLASRRGRGASLSHHSVAGTVRDHRWYHGNRELLRRLPDDVHYQLHIHIQHEQHDHRPDDQHDDHDYPAAMRRCLPRLHRQLSRRADMHRPAPRRVRLYPVTV
jgi:hypothetical protein